MNLFIFLAIGCFILSAQSTHFVYRTLYTPFPHGDNSYAYWALLGILEFVTGLVLMLIGVMK